MSAPAAADVHISPRGEARLRHGHPWIYRSDVAADGVTGGSVVRVRGARDRVLGHAFFSDQSQIALRMLTRDDGPVDEAFWGARLDAALRADDHLHAARIRFARARAKHAQVSHHAMSDDVLRHTRQYIPWPADRPWRGTPYPNEARGVRPAWPCDMICGIILTYRGLD